jgi:hypothetical protein
MNIKASRLMLAGLATTAVVLGVVLGATPAAATTSQTITFGGLPNITYGAAPFTVSATGGGSGNPVTFSTPSTACSVNSHNNSTATVTVVSHGSCEVDANQAGNGSYSAAPQVSRSFTIQQATLTVAGAAPNQVFGTTASVGANITGFQYSDTAHELTGSPNCTTTATSTSSVAGSPYPITCTQGTLSDTAAPFGTGNYTFTFVAGSLTVVPATVTVIADNKTITYGQPDPAFTFHSTGLVGGDSLTATPTCSVSGAHANVGTYSIACSGASADSNYTIAYQNGTLQINPKALTVTADNKGISFGDSLPTFTATTTGFINGDGFTTAPSCNVSGSPSSVGTYLITCSGADAGPNYTISYVQGTLTIAPAGVTITADSQTVTYGQNDPTFTFSVSGLKNGDSLTTSPTCQVNGNHRSVGTYSIVCSGANAAGNYTYTYVAGTLHVTPAALTITAQNQTKMYGQDDPQFSFTVSGFVGGDSLFTDPTCGVSGVHVHVSSYTISCSSADAGSNYTINYFPGTLVITKASLTVTANSAERAYGVPNAPLAATITGFQNGDTTANLLGAPSLSTSATTGSDPGRYTISVGMGTLASPDYTFTFQPGTLTVDEAAVNIVGATVRTSKSIFTSKMTMSATLTNASSGGPAVGLTVLFTARAPSTGKVFQCTAVSNSNGLATCFFRIGSPNTLKNTTYLVQSQGTIDYLPGTGSGNIIY